LIRVLQIVAIGAVALAAIGADAPPPATMTSPFTAAQAHDGRGVYVASCAKCHAAGLTGGSAPDLFGRSFTASRLTMGGLHQEVTNEMPLDAPASLTPAQYAAVIAYLLASNCYAPGTTPYPSTGPVPNRTDHVATQNGATAPCTVP
jgi:mono/diheme cytochrome c family protein